MREVVASVQTGSPVEHARVPAWHRFVGVQVVPGLQSPHAPAEQTWFVPHVVPSFWLPVSTHVETPVMHDVVPT